MLAGFALMPPLPVSAVNFYKDYTTIKVVKNQLDCYSMQGIFTNNQGFSSRRPAVSFEGAFSINYFFTPKYAPAEGITLYYWTKADFAAAEVLTVGNASGAIADLAMATAVYGYHAKACFG